MLAMLPPTPSLCRAGASKKPGLVKKTTSTLRLSAFGLPSEGGVCKGPSQGGIGRVEKGRHEKRETRREKREREREVSETVKGRQLDGETVRRLDGTR